MKKDFETKIMNCLIIILLILILNSIVLFMIVSKINNANTNSIDNSTSNNNNNNNYNNYDVSMFTSLTAEQVIQKIKSGDLFVLFIGKETCVYCQKILPNLQKAQSNYKYTTVYLDIAKALSSDSYKELAALLNVEKTINGETKPFGEFEYTPMVAVINKGKMVDGMIGYNTYENLASFLEKSGIKK